MTYSYKDDQLTIGQFSWDSLLHKVGSPVYVYNVETIKKQYKHINELLSPALSQPLLVRYAIKANSNQAILKTVKELGSGVEVVSGGELERALKAEISPSEIVFSGVGKTDNEITFALQADIEQLSVESIEELKKINAIASQQNKKARVCLRINPDVSANTHAKITTGAKDNKFGIPVSQYAEALRLLESLPFIDCFGLSMHLGSQIKESTPYQNAFKILKELALQFLKQGNNLRRLDLGGGFAVPYHENDPSFGWGAYADALKRELGSFKCDFVIEPGRYLVAEAGVLLTKILYIKRTPHKTFIVVDAGMNDMMRSALYDAQHSILPCRQSNSLAPTLEKVGVVGPVCESSDYFARDILLPASLKEGDVLAITCTGAYGASLSSTYNSRPLIPEVLVDQDKCFLIRDRVMPEQFLNFETLKCLT